MHKMNREMPASTKRFCVIKDYLDWSIVGSRLIHLLIEVLNALKLFKV